MRKWIFSALLILSAQASAHTKQLCEGFFPENDLWIPDDGVSAYAVNKSQFTAVLDKIQSMYAEEVRKRGARLKIERFWNDGTVNAYAYQEGNDWFIAMYGGLARHPAIKYEGFATVACHEMGHHLAGAPKHGQEGWASNEGQSDYYSTSKCLKRMFENEDNERALKNVRLDPTAVSACKAAHRSKQDEWLCIRVAMAGVDLATVLADFSADKKVPRLDTPDQRKVGKTDDRHPRAQCRMDTYFQGALCTASPWSAVSDADENQGYCADERVYNRGLRPRCWYSPKK